MLAETQVRAVFASTAKPAGKRNATNPTTKKIAALNGMGHTGAISNPRFQSFYCKIYFPIGGMEQVVGAFKAPKKSRKTKSSKMRSKPRHNTGFQNLIKVATVFDYHHRELSSDAHQFGKASIEKASKALSVTAKPKGSKKKMTGLSRGHIQELLKEHRNALALLYGAHYVSVRDTALLELLLDKPPRLEEVVEHLREWLSYAKYFHAQVLSNAKGDWTKTFGPQLRGLQPRQPPLAQLPLEQTDLIRKVFREKRQSEAKVR